MEELLSAAVERMRDEGAEFCDARHQFMDRITIMVVDGGVKTLSQEGSGGVCLRARKGGAWGYASTVALDKKALLESASFAVRNAGLGTAKGKPIPEVKGRKAKVAAPVKIHPSKVPLEEKLALAWDLESAQRFDKRIVNSNAFYMEGTKHSALVNSFGASLEWEEARVRAMAQTVASNGERSEIFYKIKDGSGGFELVKTLDASAMGKSTAEEAIKMLSAEKCPSGPAVAITNPQITGLLAHEVMGHASEADEIVKKRSFLTGIVGKKVANEQITMVDDGTRKGAFGFIPFDDEGTPASRTVIIKNGVYQGYMQDLETAAEMGVKPTGNGRAQDFSRRVFVRMTNTFFEAGDWTLDEMVEGVKHGVLTDQFISGMEDPVGGGFEAKALRGFLIENGRITKMLRGFALTGKALQILQTTDAVGKEVELDGGMCGKGVEDYVPVSSGGPYCRSQVTLGGG
jgi:TldD protein